MCLCQDWRIYYWLIVGYLDMTRPLKYNWITQNQTHLDTGSDDIDGMDRHETHFFQEMESIWGQQTARWTGCRVFCFVISCPVTHPGRWCSTLPETASVLLPAQAQPPRARAPWRRIDPCKICSRAPFNNGICHKALLNIGFARKHVSSAIIC